MMRPVVTSVTSASAHAIANTSPPSPNASPLCSRLRNGLSTYASVRISEPLRASTTNLRSSPPVGLPMKSDTVG